MTFRNVKDATWTSIMGPVTAIVVLAFVDFVIKMVLSFQMAKTDAPSVLTV